MSWLLKGVMAGAAIGLGAVAIVGTGGLAAAAIVGGLAAGGAGIGEVLSTMSWAPKEVCGVIKGAGSNNVFINGIPAARAHVDVVECYKHSPPYLPIATGSATVTINGQPAARVDDKAGCSAVITGGSHDVFIGGDTTQTDVLEPENLVPAGVHAALLIVGVGSAIVLGGPIIAAVGLAGGTVGQLGGEWLGGEAFGVGSDGQKWAMLGGSLLGGVMGAKGGANLAGKWTAWPLLRAQKGTEGKPYGADIPPRTFITKDPGVPELIKAIEAKFPRKVRNAEIQVYRPDGTPYTVFDVVTDTHVIQVKVGTGKGIVSQIQTTQSLTDLEVIGFDAGNLLGKNQSFKGSIMKDAEQKGIYITSDINALLEKIGTTK